MGQRAFVTRGFNISDKKIWVDGPGLSFAVDYDGVDHREVRTLIKKMLAVLNDHWDDKSWQEIAKEELKKTGG